MTKVLLEHGMDPDLPNWQRQTPLHALAGDERRHVSDAQRLELLRLFLDFGADIHRRDEEYRSTPLWPGRPVAGGGRRSSCCWSAAQRSSCRRMSVGRRRSPGPVGDITMRSWRSWHPTGQPLPLGLPDLAEYPTTGPLGSRRGYGRSCARILYLPANELLEVVVAMLRTPDISCQVSIPDGIAQDLARPSNRSEKNAWSNLASSIAQAGRRCLLKRA